MTQLKDVQDWSYRNAYFVLGQWLQADFGLLAV